MRTSRRSWLALTWLSAAGAVSWMHGCKSADVEPADKYGGPSRPESSTHAPPLPISGEERAAWYSVAVDSKLANREHLDELRERLRAESASGAPEVERTLVTMAATAATVEGLRAASRLAHDTTPSEDRAVKGSPWRAGLLHDGAMAVLRGVIARACKQAQQNGTLATVSLDLMQAVRQMPLPRAFGAGGLTDGLADRQNLQSELLANLDDETAVVTLRAAEKWPRVPNPR